MSATAGADGAQISNPIESFHEAAADSLRALVSLQDIAARYAQATSDQQSDFNANCFYQDHVVPLVQGLEKIAGCPQHAQSFKQMTAARLALGRSPLSFGNMQSPNAHEFALGMTIYFLRVWNRYARPSEPEPLTLPSGPSRKVFYAPKKDTDLDGFLKLSHEHLRNFELLALHVDLELEYAKASEGLQATPPLGGGNAQPHPCWNAERKELTFAGKAKRYRQSAERQTTVLAALEEEGWPPRIDDPLPQGALRDTVYHLNASIKNSGLPLRFERDGNGTGILWLSTS